MEPEQAGQPRVLSQRRYPTARLGITSWDTVSPGIRLGVLFCLFLFLTLVAACDENLSGEAFVRNRTLQAIDVFHEVDGQEAIVVSLPKPPSASYDQGLFVKGEMFPTGCTTGSLVARRPDGDEIARLNEELCVGDAWVIEPDGRSRIIG